MELYKTYRPSNLNAVIGQDKAIKVLQSKLDANKFPHSTLLTGPAGVGKTTIARCLRKPLKCHKREFREYDIGQAGGIDEIRGIRVNTQKLPLYGSTKIYFLDEVAQAKSIAQDAMLKMLEESPNHVYFIFATTDPQRLKKTVRSRFMEIPLKSLDDESLNQILINVIEAEDKDISEDVISKIIEYSDCSARIALELLEKIIDLDDEKEIIEIIEQTTLEKQAVELCRLLLNNHTRWQKIATKLKELDGEEPEGLRRMVLGYMRSCLLTGSKISPRAYYIMTCFERNFFDTGKAGLAMACWESMSSKQF